MTVYPAKYSWEGRTLIPKPPRRVEAAVRGPSATVCAPVPEETPWGIYQSFQAALREDRRVRLRRRLRLGRTGLRCLWAAVSGH